MTLDIIIDEDGNVTGRRINFIDESGRPLDIDKWEAYMRRLLTE